MEVTSKQDIVNAEDVASLVRDFYTKIYADEVLRPIFAEVAQVNLEDHLPKMNSFWETVLLGERSYRGNPMAVHFDLNGKKPLNECHFIRWLSLFCLTVDAKFAGPTAEKAKESARRISKNIEWTIQRARDRAASSLTAENIL